MVDFLFPVRVHGCLDGKRVEPHRPAESREYEGYLLRHDALIFLDVPWLVAMLKPILHHNERVTYDDDISLGKIGNRRVVLSTPEHKNSWKKLKDEAILEPDLARVLWPESLARHMLLTLEELRLAFPLPGDDQGRVVVLLRLPMKRPQSVADEVNDFRSKHSAALTVVWKLRLGVPLGAIEEVIARCSALGDVKTFWRFGLLVEGDFAVEGMGGTFAVLVDFSHKDRRIVIEVFGNKESVAPWAALSFAMSTLLAMTRRFPGLPWEAFMKCPDHPSAHLGVSKV